MFKLWRATRRGERIAHEASTMAMQIVNDLLRDGADVRASDTASIVREAFAFYSTMSLADWMNDLHRGQMVVHGSEVLKRWLDEVSLTSASPEARTEVLSNFSESLIAYWKEWLGELVDENPEMRGLPEFLDPAIERLVRRLGVFLHARFPEQTLARDVILHHIRTMGYVFQA